MRDGHPFSALLCIMNNAGFRRIHVVRSKEREPVNIVSLYSGDDFERNLITVRCEARFGLAISDQFALRSVDLTTP